MRTIVLASLAAASITGCDNINLPTQSSQTAAVKSTANQNRLEADLRYLADDLLEGREAGTRGYDLAAKYVAERYRAVGLVAAGNNGSYFQNVPMREVKNRNENGGTITLSGEGAPDGLAPGVDYFVGGSARALEGAVEAPVVFVGYGLVAEDHDRNDYEGLDVEGKIVAVLFGAPKFLNSEERAHYRATTAKRASERGAVGMIIIWTPTLGSLIPFDVLLEIQKGSTNMAWLHEDGTPYSSAPNLNGGGVLSPDLSEKMFASTAVSWEEIVAADASDEGYVKGFDMGLTARIEYKSTHRELTSPNVVGMLPGSDPAMRDQYVVLTAHLDHEGVKPTPEEDDDEIYNGAMDNASGIASMLEVAHLLAHNPPRRSVVFVALTAEEKGLVGSDYFARNPTVSADQVVANINLDMPILTYEFSDIVAFGGERSNMYPVVEAAAKRAGLILSPDPQPDQGFFVRSDQYSFVKQGVPAVYLDLGFGNDGEAAQTAFQKDHYHQPSDEADVVDYEQLRRFAQVNYEIASGVANMDERPLWKKDDFFATIFNGPMEE